MKRYINKLNKLFFAKRIMRKELDILRSKYITLIDMMEEGDYESALEYAEEFRLNLGMCYYFYKTLHMWVYDFDLELYGTTYFIDGRVSDAIFKEDIEPIQTRIDWIDTISKEQLNILVKLYKES